MLLEVNMSGLSLLTGCWFRLKSKGEWSDDRFERELALIRFRGMFFVSAKSIKSGSFQGSLGQCVGEPEETQSSLLLGFIIARFPVLSLCYKVFS